MKAEFFIVAGSGRRIGRTTVSVLLAYGMAKRGLAPHLIQVLAAGEDPIIHPRRSAVSVEVLEAADVDSIETRVTARVSDKPLTPVVIDLPAMALPTTLLDVPSRHVILPMPSHHPVLKEFTGDFAALHPVVVTESGPGLAVVPAGWPVVMRPSDFEPVLEREAARGRHRVSPRARNIQSLGVTDIALAHLPAIVAGRINATPMFGKLAARLARDTLCQSGSHLIGRDPVWGICDP